MLRHMQSFVTSVLLLLFSFCVNAIELGVEFSADAIQVAPGRSTMQSKMYVSKKAVRTEMTQQGQFVVNIAYPREGKRLLLFPDKKMYMEQTGLRLSPSWSGNSAKSPCEGIPKSSCEKLGHENLRSVYVEKWQVERSVKGKSFRSLHWIDTKRKLAIKEMLPDGSVSELIMLGKGKLNGRDVEQWESRFYNPSGQRMTAKQWYDPELKIVIREEQENGYLRELTNIKVGKQDENLYRLPADYKKMVANKNSENNLNKRQ